MANQSIFIANDDQTYLDLVKEVLNDAGYTNVTMHIGTSVFHKIRDIQPDLILLDIHIANPARGWTNLDMLTLHPKTRHIPIIICSTDMRLINEKADLLHHLECQTLEKPFDLEMLIEKVASAIGPPSTM